MERKIIAMAAFFGMTAVMLDAFGAHKLKETLAPDMLAAFKTGARYQMYHAFLLLFVGIYPVIDKRVKSWILWLVTIGILCFSGSLYLLSIRKITGVDFGVIGWITPVGGLLLIAAWTVLLIGVVRKKS